MIIKWTNRYSGETGYIKDIDYKNRHFNNTFEYEEAKKYNSKDIIKKTIDKLIEYGEGINNNFEIVN